MIESRFNKEAPLRLVNRRILAGWMVVAALGLTASVALVWHRYAGIVSLDCDPADQAAGVAANPSLLSGVRSLDGDLESIRAACRVPALAAAVVRADGVAAMGAVGVRKAGSSLRVEVTDRFHIGSCTKSMTATLIGMLVDRGLLRWETTLADIFPDVAQGFRPEYRMVTVDQLLHHRSGLPDDREDSVIYRRLLNLRGPLAGQRMDLVAIGMQLQPSAAPGTQTNYSNMGYSILGAIVERVTGVSWEENMRRSLFEPLGMDSAGFGSPSSGQSLKQPWGHRITSFPFARLVSDSETSQPPATSPSGNVSLTLEDWAKYALLHLNAERGQCRLLECATFGHLHSASFDSKVACGWGLNRYDWAGTVLEHAGSEGSWYATIGIAPEMGFAILTASNQGGPAGSKACEGAALVAARRWLETH